MFTKYEILENSKIVQHKGENRSKIGSHNVHHGYRSGNTCTISNICKIYVSHLCVR